MPKTEPFEKFSKEYEEWFERFDNLYKAEIGTIKKLLPDFKKGIEIGAGSGRFAVPLGIKEGVEPSSKMSKIAKSKGIKVIKGEAENLPLKDESYDLALMVTTICFVDDPQKALKEIWRILKKEGYVIIGFVDKNSNIGKLYQKKKEDSRFYKEALFFSFEDIAKLLKKCGFTDIKSYQTLFGKDLKSAKTNIKEGFGEGAFIAVRAKKP